MCQELQIFCICIYVFWCKLSLFRLCNNDFGIIPLEDITIGSTCAAFIIIIIIITTTITTTETVDVTAEFQN